MITVQHSAKDDRIYFKQAVALQRAGFEVSIVHGSKDGKLFSMDGAPVDIGPDELGINHMVVNEPTNLLGQLSKKVFRGAFYNDFIRTATDTGATIFVAHEAQSIYIARKCAEQVNGRYVFDSHESLHLESPKAKYAIRKEMPKMPYLVAANSITQQAIHEFNPSMVSEVVYNASPIDATEVSSQDMPLIVHEGSLPYNRGLELMMEAFVLLKKDKPEFRFKIVGEVKGEEKIYFDKMCSAHGLKENIHITGWQPYDQLSLHLADASIGLILNTLTPNNLYAGPANKLFNYMACNTCVVAVDLPETTRILHETGAGITLTDREPATLAKLLNELIEQPSLLLEKRQAAHKAHEKLSWAEEAKKLVRFYEDISSKL